MLTILKNEKWQMWGASKLLKWNKIVTKIVKLSLWFYCKWTDFLFLFICPQLRCILTLGDWTSLNKTPKLGWKCKNIIQQVKSKTAKLFYSLGFDHHYIGQVYLMSKVGFSEWTKLNLSTWHSFLHVTLLRHVFALTPTRHKCAVTGGRASPASEE